uniref:Trochin n=1 Tax=Terebratalia transversa TaxID=34513 RepID=A0A6M3Z653_TERTR|nr:trochin [Terebratalia transversa]
MAQYFHERLSGRTIKPYYPTPTNNYLSGDGKSAVWKGHSFYVPSERRFVKYHEYRALPPERRADAKDYQREDDWRKFQYQRDRPKGYFVQNYKFTDTPELKLHGYCTNPFNLHRTGVEARTLYDPLPDGINNKSWRGPHGYYGYYHERLDARDTGGFRITKQLYNDEDYLKWEQMRTRDDPNNLLGITETARLTLPLV